jgi:large conductance mechanosensitive channel
MSLFKEFRDFAIKGNVDDRASGGVIGSTFGAIVFSLVDDVFMPLIGLAFGRLGFSSLYVVLDNPNSVAVPSFAAAKAAGGRRLLSVCSSMQL